MYIEDRIEALERRLKAVEEALRIQTQIAITGTYDIIETEVAKQTQVPLESIRSRDRHQEVAMARHMIRALAADVGKMKINHIARIQHCDHGSVGHSISVIKNFMEMNPETKAIYDRCRDQISKCLDSTSSRS